MVEMTLALKTKQNKTEVWGSRSDFFNDKLTVLSNYHPFRPGPCSAQNVFLPERAVERPGIKHGLWSHRQG